MLGVRSLNSENNSKPKKNRKGFFYNFCYDFVRITGALPMLIWMRPKVYHPYGKKKLKGSLLITANHRGYLDPISVHVAFPFKRLNCLATKDLYNTKLKAKFFNQMHCIMVDKENFTVSAFHDVVERLCDGCTVLIFPEGRINNSEEDTLLAFKSGAALMAHKANAPILPVYIVKREKWYHRQRVVVGEPFYIEGAGKRMLSLDQLNAVSENLRQKELALREYFESLPIHEKLSKNSKSETEQPDERNVKINDEQTVL